MPYCEICGLKVSKMEINRGLCPDCYIETLHKCKWCGKLITRKGNTNYCCNECRILANAEKKRNSTKSAQKRIAEEKLKNSLSAVAKRATECGLTYGQYMAKIEAEKLRVKK
jgi:hypothetical protein